MSNSVFIVFDSSTVITPSLPTTFIASAINWPISSSPEDTAPTWAIASSVSTVLDWCFNSLTATSTALAIPFLINIGFAPAVTFLRPSLIIAWAKTVAVVVPSPATSLVLVATCLTSWAPIFSNLSSNSISLAIVTPSFVISGTPYILSSITFLPFGPNVTLTVSANLFTPLSRALLVSSANLISFGMLIHPPTYNIIILLSLIYRFVLILCNFPHLLLFRFQRI